MPDVFDEIAPAKRDVFDEITSHPEPSPELAEHLPSVTEDELLGLGPETRIQKRARLVSELEAARKEIGPIIDWLAADEGISTTQKQAAEFASPIGFPRMVRPSRPSPDEPAVVQGVRAFGETIAEFPTEMTKPTMLPLLPLAAVPLPGGPAVRHAIPKAMGTLFGGQAVGAGAGELVAGIEQGDPRLIGRGAAQVGIGGTMVAPVVAGAMPTRAGAIGRAGESVGRTIAPFVPEETAVNLAPMTIDALKPFLTAKVQPGERAGLDIRPEPPKAEPAAPTKPPEAAIVDRLSVVERILKQGRRSDRAAFEQEKQNILYELDSLDKLPPEYVLEGNQYVSKTAPPPEAKAAAPAEPAAAPEAKPNGTQDNGNLKGLLTPVRRSTQ